MLQLFVVFLKCTLEKGLGCFQQQIFKFKVNSGNNQEFWRVNTDFSSYELKWTIDAIVQHIGFYHTTENPCVMKRKNHMTKNLVNI